ncbi:MAG: hypothetical protein IBJ11_09465, partial [Phycisphaerales bacterium]|nr:hypothetical protein [Phycisphaerales bacterium]
EGRVPGGGGELGEGGVRRKREAGVGLVQERPRLGVEVHRAGGGLAGEAVPGTRARPGGDAAGGGASVVVSGGVGRGSCVVRTERGRIDASLDTQIAAMVRALLPGSAAAEGGGPNGAMGPAVAGGGR